MDSHGSRITVSNPNCSTIASALTMFIGRRISSTGSVTVNGTTHLPPADIHNQLPRALSTRSGRTSMRRGGLQRVVRDDDEAPLSRAAFSGLVVSTAADHQPA